MPTKFKAELSRILGTMHRELVAEKVPHDKKGRHLELHPSSFPFCPLQTFHKLASEGLYDHRWENTQSNYYCDVGTVVHTVMQRFFGRAMHVVGDWKCLKCKDVKEFTTFEKAGLCCGQKRHYEELGIKFRKTIRGHTDGLFFYEGEYWVLDYKTSSVEKTTKYKEDGVGLPLISNREQIRSYVVLLEKEYGVKIKGWVLLYLARDNPFKHHAICTEVTTDELREASKKQMVRYDKQYSTLLDIDKSGDGLSYLIQTKPCQTRKDYEDLFESPWDKCPLESVCFDEYKLTRTLDKLISNSKFIPIRSMEPQAGTPPKPEKPVWSGSGKYLPPKIDEF